jgi:hypothetical protein
VTYEPNTGQFHKTQIPGPYAPNWQVKRFKRFLLFRTQEGIRYSNPDTATFELAKELPWQPGGALPPVFDKGWWMGDHFLVHSGSASPMRLMTDKDATHEHPSNRPHGQFVHPVKGWLVMGMWHRRVNNERSPLFLLRRKQSN